MENKENKKRELTNSQEEYLKTIYILKTTNKEIKVTSIAERLGITKASVNSGIKTLASLGLVQYEPYGSIEITKEGIIEAKKVIEKNDIVKLFLKEIIEVKEDLAEEEAKKIKTILSDDTLNKLARYTYKELGMSNHQCLYDINKMTCIECQKKKDIQSKIEETDDKE